MDITAQKRWLQVIKSIDSTDTPLFITDLSIVRKNIENFKAALPRVKLYYAVKAFSHPTVLKEMAGLVDGFDIASAGELDELKVCKDSKSYQNILFSNPVKIPEHISRAHVSGVNRFAFDSVEELHKISKLAPGAEVYLRIKVSDHGSTFPLSKKFGADSSHAVAFFGAAEDLDLKPIGLTFHVGSQSENVKTWENALKHTSEVIDRLKRSGFTVSFLDIGGGFPARYFAEVPTIKEIGKTIHAALEEYVDPNIEIVAEPGRFLTAEASVILTSVIGREGRAGQEWLYLDMGVFQGLMECLEMEDWKYPIFPENNHGTSALPRHFALTGPTCDAYDTIGFDVPLPSSIKVGERIVIGSVGAYTVVYGSTFNGFSVPNMVFIDGRKEK